MDSVSWHAIQDNGTSDEEDTVLFSSNEYSVNARLLNNVDDNHERFKKSSSNLRKRMAYKRNEERKFKHSLISVLVIGIALILMVNIGLGIKHCPVTEDLDHDISKVTSDSMCRDESTNKLFPWQHYRLPAFLSPESYHIFMHPNLTTQNYTCQLNIIVTASDDTSYLILHSRGHFFTSVKVRNTQNLKKNYTFSEVLKCEKYDTVSFAFRGFKFQKGNTYQIFIDFNGNLTFSLGGFYLSKYRKADGTDKLIGTTQFESVDARAAFPCFDEPAFKANFSLSLVREPGMFTLFNMPLTKTVQWRDGLEMDVFPFSLKMSTYLVAFVLSDFDHITNYTQTGVKVSVYCRPDKIKEAYFALEFAIEALQQYEKRFEIPYPLSKLDLVAVPDFAAGAMENWGLITYRETSLLFNPNTSSVHDQEWVAKVVAHELSHQWFGNLVTMQWWNDLWLNEGFASYIEIAEVDYLRPQWKIMDDFAYKYILSAMETDCSYFTHPLSQLVTNSREIQEMFDSISYAKGASMISMLVDYLKNTFFDGVDTYLKKYKYRNAVNHDLLLAISDESNDSKQDIIKMMNTWTSQAGFPVLHVSAKGSQISINQTRFLYPVKQPRTESSSLWEIPISFITDSFSRTRKPFLMSEQNKEIKVDNFKWIKLNHNFTGYYKVSYDKNLWQKLIKQMKSDHTVFTPSDRTNILSDAFTMARVGHLNYNMLFDLLQYIKKEDAYSPVLITIAGISYIKSMLRHGLRLQHGEYLDRFIIDIFTPLYTAMAWKNRTELDRIQLKLQSAVVSVMCSCNYEACINTAYAKFSDWRSNHAKLSPQDMTIVFKTAVLQGEPSDWDYIWSAYLNTTDVNLQTKLLLALSFSTNVKRIVFLQDKLLNGDHIRSQSMGLVCSSMLHDVVGSMLVWKFIKKNWDKLLQIYPVTEFSMRTILYRTMNTIVTEDELTEAKNYFSVKGVSNLKSIERAVEATQINLYWFDHRLQEVLNWLDDKYEIKPRFFF